MESNFENVTREVINVVSTYGLSVLGAVIILIVGFWIAGWASRAVNRAMAKAPRVDETLSHFFASLARYTIIIITIIAVLNRFGVETTSLIAVVGAAGLAIGLALQGTLSNIAAGVMLLIFRPFRVGQFIEAGGIAGTVESVTLFVTELNTPDNVHIIAPNSQLWGTSVKNYGHNANRRVDINVGIDYGDDIGKAFEVIKSTAGADNRVQNDPEPAVMVTGLGDSSVDLQLRVWCTAGDYWGVKFDLTRAVKEALDGAGVSIPFPQRVVHAAPAS
jgi:small conductance mechanosensitive channel